MDNMGKGAILTGKNKEKVYPITATDLVYDKDTKKNMKQTLSEKVEEAPLDGKQYARINGAWGEVEAGSVSETALITLLPNDAALYGATVKVTTSDGQTLLNTTWQGSVLSVQVRAGLVYTVTVGAKDGYITPAAVSHTAEKGVTRSISMTYTPSTLTLGILSNQGTDDSAISGIKATVKYGSTTVQMGNGETISLPLNVAVTITFPAVANYKAPSSISFTHSGGAVQKSGTYQTEIVNVTLSSDNGTSVVGQKVTINGTQHTWNGTTISQKVPFGTSYSVSVDAKSGYTTPSSQSFTANQSSRNLQMVYGEAKPGLYVQDIDGALYNSNAWDSSKTPNGIAIVTENCSFVLALNSVSVTNVKIWDDGVTYPDLATKDTSEALQDFDGISNSQKMLEVYRSGGGNYYANEKCEKYTFPNGKSGYLGSAGEWMAVMDNYDEVYSLVRTLGGSFTAGGQIRTSTRAANDTDGYCCFYSIQVVNKSLISQAIHANTQVFAFTTLN